MSEIQNHKIQTASLLVDFEGMEEGLGVQDSLGLLFYEKIKPALEKAFDNYGDPKATIFFEKLELDCGQISYENWEEKIVKQVLIQLEEKMKSPTGIKKEIVPAEKKAEEVFFHFLAKGYFPWNSTFAKPKDLEESILIEFSVLEKLKSVFLSNPAILRRFSSSFSTDFVSRLIELFIENSDSKSLALVKHLQTQKKPIVQRDLFYALILSYANHLPFSISKFLENLVCNFSVENLSSLGEYIAEEFGEEKDVWKEIKSVGYKSVSPEFRVRFSYLIQIILKKDPLFLKRRMTSLKDIEFLKTVLSPNNGLNTTFKSMEKKINLKSDPESQFENTGIKKSNIQDVQEIEEGIFIENAGLVLLHPFLAGLFSNLQLTENGKFVTDSDQSVATRILQFLVYGENEVAENFYPLNKILCGMEISQVLGEEIEIGQETKIEGEELLQAVIGHWSVLKNTSLEGLRETFLQRNGKISRVEKGWKLQVERKTVDVLLAKLPWGIGIIKLPWMTEMMYVEWD